MTNSEQAIREFVDKWGFSQDKTDEGFLIDNDRTKQCLSDLTALISEHYVAKEDAGYPREFVEWIGDDCSPCNLLRNDEEEFEKWVVYEINSMDWKFSCKTTDELFNYWRENER